MVKQRWEKLKNYFQSDRCVAETVRNLGRTFGQREAPSAADVGKFIKISKGIQVLVRCTQLKELLLLEVCVKTQKSQLAIEHNWTLALL